MEITWHNITLNQIHKMVDSNKPKELKVWTDKDKNYGYFSMKFKLVIVNIQIFSEMRPLNELNSLLENNCLSDDSSSRIIHEFRDWKGRAAKAEQYKYGDEEE